MRIVRGRKKMEIKLLAILFVEKPFHPAPLKKLLFCVFRKIWSKSQAFCRFGMAAFEGALLFQSRPPSSFFVNSA
jgi:hypothetical protein